MNRKIEIELFEESEQVNFYTLRYEDEDTEFDKFLDQFPYGSEYDEDIGIIIKWIDKIGEKGAFERYFRVKESKFSDSVCAIPIETEKCDIRLYIIRISENIVILGNGGIKTTKTYNEDKRLDACVKLLHKIDVFLESRIHKEKVYIYGKQLYGDLNFYLKEDDHDKE